MECFGCFVVALLFVGLSLLLGWLRSKIGGGSAQGGDATAIEPLQMSVVVGSKDFGGSDFPVFDVFIRGLITAPHDNVPIRYKVTAVDVTSKERGPLPVLCMIPALQDDDSTSLAVTSPVITLPYEHSVITEWLNVLAVPIPALVFPERGHRDLAFVLKVVPASQTTALTQTAFRLSYDNPQIGYLDAREAASRTGELAVRLAIGVGVADGALARSEGEAIREYIRKRIASAPGEQGEVKDRLNRAAREAVSAVRKGQATSTTEICAELVDIAPMAERYEILMLCLNIVRADGMAKEQELDMVRLLADLLKVDADKFRAMSDKVVPVGIHEVENVDQLLGIRPDMPLDEVRAHLRREYQKWNARVTHADPAIREQADRMLELIARARAESERAEPGSANGRATPQALAPKCRRCGAALTKGTRFCTQCGARSA